jgi:hypothetical protein
MAKAGQPAGFIDVGLDELGADGAGHAKRGDVAHVDDEVRPLVVGVVSQEAKEQAHRSGGVTAPTVGGEDVVPDVDFVWREPVAVSVVIDPSNDLASDQDHCRRSRLALPGTEPALPLGVATGDQDLVLTGARRTEARHPVGQGPGDRFAHVTRYSATRPRGCSCLPQALLHELRRRWSGVIALVPEAPGKIPDLLFNCVDRRLVAVLGVRDQGPTAEVHRLCQ